MADGNKVFVSPGVYTSEKDLTFVAQSVGVTTLGLVGETLKGPAFEPIFIQSYDDFTTRFGGTSPIKYVDSQIPKYELGYIAKSYLSQSNQLFVTRVLGLSGYDAGPSWSIQTIGNLDPTSFSAASTAYTSGSTSLPFYIPLTGSNVTIGSEMFSNATLSADFISTLPSSIKAHFGNGNAANPLQDWEETIYLTNGTSTTLKADLLTWAKAIYGIASTFGSADVGSGPYLATGATYSSCTGSNPSMLVSATTPWYGGAIYQYGVLPTDYSNLATATTTNSLSATNSTTLYNRLGVDSTTALNEFDYENDAWYYGLFDYTGSSECCSGTTYSGVSYQLYATTANTGSCQQISTGSTTIGGTAFTVFSGYCAVDYVDWGGVQPYTDYDGMVVLTFRSRGLSTKASGGPVYEITANTVSFNCSGGTYYKVLEDPFASFGINARTAVGKDYLHLKHQ